MKKCRDLFSVTKLAFSFLLAPCSYHFLGYVGQCNAELCNDNEQFTKEENEIALESEFLLQKVEATSISIDMEIGIRSFEPCPCVDQFECPWSKKLLENANELSDDHPTKRKSFEYIESKFCEVEMDYKAVECCGTIGTFSDMDDPDETVTEEPIENLRNEEEIDMKVKRYKLIHFF